MICFRLHLKPPLQCVAEHACSCHSAGKKDPGIRGLRPFQLPVLLPAALVHVAVQRIEQLLVVGQDGDGEEAKPYWI